MKKATSEVKEVTVEPSVEEAEVVETPAPKAKKSPAAAYKVKVESQSGLNIRKAASSDADVVRVARNGEVLKASGTSGDYYKVADGFCLMQYCTKQ